MERRGSRLRRIGWGVALVVLLQGKPAHAQSLDLGGLNDAIPADLANALILTFGSISDHRPGLAGTPLMETGAGFVMGLQASLVRIPPELNTQLEANNLSPMELPFLPMPRITLHKGFGSRVNFGLSFLGFQGRIIAGADFTLAVIHPEEGPTVALRLAYAYTDLNLSGNQFYIDTYTPQILISRKLNFADPYLGVGYSLMSGTMEVPVSSPVATTLEKDGKAASFIAFLGVAFRLGPSGLQLGMEGSYSSQDAHTLGTRFGFQF